MRDDGAGQLSRDALSILDAGRDLDGPGDLARARVRRALLAKIAAGSVTALAASTAAAGSTTAAGGAMSSGSVAAGGAGTLTAAVAAPLAKLLVPLAVVIAGGVGGTIAWQAQRDSAVRAPAAAVAAAPVRAPVMAPVVEPAPAPTLAPAPVTAPRERIVHRAHVAAPVREAVPANRLAEETALLAASNAELRSGDARGALVLLNDYDRRYPSGVLREEVLATRVIARCQLGPEPDATARRAADAFLTRHPASPLAPRVRSSCSW
jgi:hypothetical protein